MTANVVHDAWVRAGARWHALAVSEEAFRARVARDATDDGAGQLGDLATDELYLAIACGQGDSTAIQLFEDAYFREIEVVLRKMRCVELRDEVCQLLRVKLFVAGSRERPSIDDYGGRGPLKRWFRMVATRTVLNLKRRKVAQPEEDEVLANLLGGDLDPELELIKQRYRLEFKSAFATCFAALEDEDKHLIRYAFRDQMTVDAIGTLFDVHRATAARWVVKAHRRLVKRTRDHLHRELGISPSEFESIFKLIVSRLELTLEGKPEP